MNRGLLLLAFLAACTPAPPEGLPPESDAHAVMDPDRNLSATLEDGSVVQLTDLPGAEEAEATSPDGRWVAFVGGASGIASVWVVPVPRKGERAAAPIQLTNVGLEHVGRTPGQAPEGFVPTPEQGPLRWADERTIVWTARGQDHSVQVPR